MTLTDRERRERREELAHRLEVMRTLCGDSTLLTSEGEQAPAPEKRGVKEDVFGLDWVPPADRAK